MNNSTIPDELRREIVAKAEIYAEHARDAHPLYAYMAGATEYATLYHQQKEMTQKWREDAMEATIQPSQLTMKYDELKAEYERLKDELESEKLTYNLLAQSYDQGIAHLKTVGIEQAALQAKAQRLVDDLQDLVEAVPNQTEDADWWPDSLRSAVAKATLTLQEWNTNEPKEGEGI